MEMLLTFQSKWEEKMKRETGGGNSNVYKLDKVPTPVEFDACVDNGLDILCEARNLRHPVGKREDAWKNMPAVRVHVYKTLDLKPHGIEGQVAEEAIGILHDRRRQLRIILFAKINANIATSQLKVRTEHVAGGSSISTTELDWKSIGSIKMVTEAIVNYDIVNRLIWPIDFTGIVMLKLLNDYLMVAYGDEKLRIKVISEFFYRVSSENRMRPARFAPPLDYQEQEHVLKATLRDNCIDDARPSMTDSRIPRVGADQKALTNLQQNLTLASNRGNKSQGPRGQSRPKLATVKSPSGKFVCWLFNEGTCTRQQHQDGCKDQKTQKEFSHLCSYQNPQTQVYCMARHPKHKNH